MKGLNKIKSNRRSPAMMLVKAACSPAAMMIALKNIRKYCLGNKIDAGIDPGGVYISFTAAQQHLANNLTESLSVLHLEDCIIDVWLYLQYGKNLQYTAIKLCGALNNEDKHPHYQDVNRIDRMLRQKYAINGNINDFSWEIFSGHGLDLPKVTAELQPLIIYLASAGDKKSISKELDNVQLSVLLTLSIAVMEDLSLKQVLKHCWIDISGTYDTEQLMIKMLQAIGTVKKHKSQALLLMPGGAILFRLEKQNKIVGHYITSSNSPIDALMVSKISAYLGRDKMSIKFIQINPCHIYKHKTIMHVFAAAELYQRSMENHSNLAFAKESCIYTMHKLAKKAELELKLLSKESTIADSETRVKSAARSIITLLKSYKHGFVDLFGYDVSRKRARIIDVLLNDSKNLNVIRVYKAEFAQLRRVRSHNLLHRDMLFGVFLSRVFEDSRFSARYLQKHLDSELLRLAKLNRSEYIQQKEDARHADAAIDIDTLVATLIDDLFRMLCNGKMPMQPEQWSAVLQRWFESALYKAHSLKYGSIIVPEIKKAHLFWRKMIETLQHQEMIGGFISKVCYNKAAYDIKSMPCHQQCSSINQCYYANLEKLPADLYHLHKQHISCKKIQIQARRMILIMLDYKPFSLRKTCRLNNIMDRLLSVIAEEGVYDEFALKLAPITSRRWNNTAREYEIKWSQKPKLVLKNPYFSEFIAQIIDQADMPHAAKKLHLDVFGNGLKLKGS